MSNYMVNLEWEQVDAIVIKELKRGLEAFKPENRPSYGMFSSDEAEDLKEMKKMSKAFKRVLAWYGDEVE
jgi:hypothetical protein